MKKTMIMITLLLTFASLSAMARKPAVEPVSGVEPESYNTTTPGVEVEFNFGNHIYANKLPKSETPRQTPQWLSGVTLISFVLLPFLMWFFINKATDEIEVANSIEEEQGHQTYADTISQENVASLSDHRTQHTTESKDDKKKVA